MGAIYLPIVSEFRDKGVEDAQRGLAGLSKKSGGFASSIGKAMKVAGAALLAVGAAAGAAALVGVEFAKAAAEDEAAATKLAGALKRSAGATDAQVAATEQAITQMAMATGVADDQLRPALESLVRGSGDLALAQQDLGLALDIAAATGKDVTTVADAMAKAYNGNLVSLAKLDPQVRKVVAGGGDLDDVMQHVAQTFRGAASDAANTTQGKMRRLSVAFDEAKEAIGYRLLPILSRLVDWFLTRVMPTVERVMAVFDRRGLSGVWQMVTATASEQFPRLLAYLADVGRQLLETVGRWGQAFLDWIGPRIGPMLAKLGELVAAAANWLIDTGLPKLVAKLQQLGDALVAWIGPRIKPILGKLGEVIGAIAEWVVTQALPKLAVQAAKLQWALTSWAWRLLPDVLAGIGSFIVELVKRIPGLFRNLLAAMADMGGRLFGALLGAFGSIGSGVFDGLKTALVSALNAALNAIESGLNFAIRGLNTILDGIDRAAGPWVNFGDIPEVSLPSVALASGGIVTGPTVALIGEAGPEAVIPLDRMPGPSVVVNVSGALDPVAVAGQIRRILNDDARRRTGTLAIP